MSGDVYGIPGGPAFPVSIPGAGDNGVHGMSLRDYFAAAALSGIIAQIASRDTADTASDAYAVADAMLAERAQGDRK